MWSELCTLTADSASQVVCCPGGLEVAGKRFSGDLGRTGAWRVEMCQLGMEGLLARQGGLVRGFVEYCPGEVAPLPVEAPGAAVLLCYHWVPPEDAPGEEHLAQEGQLVGQALQLIRSRFSGVAALGWDHPTHFPIALLGELGFQEVERRDYLSLMWLPFSAAARPPGWVPAVFRPQDLSGERLLAVEVGWSSRCPYSVHHAARVGQVLAGLPDAAQSLIRARFHRVDTRADAVSTSRHPWDWDWLFLNGTPVDHRRTGSDDLRRAIEQGVEGMR
ncbi:MAG: hypothetical protein ACP5G2_00090 [Candidatus Bipolaricaulaceae bacterium]